VTRFVRLILWLALIPAVAWAFGALWFDFPFQNLRGAAAMVYLVGSIALFLLLRNRRRALVLVSAGCCLILGWWLSLRPSNDRDWKPEVARTAWAEINGDRVTLHNVRDCEYHTETDFIPRWETRTVDLSRLRAVDLAITYWGPKWIAHPIVSFQFEDGLPICFSIETRLQKGQTYSAIGGLYRRCELTYVCADERDVIRLRSNFRKGEEVYLYRTTLKPARARERFLEYLATLNSLHAKPRWYNAATTNCTTSIRTQHASAERTAWDWRILFNGYLDQLLYEKGVLAGGLPFAKLKERAHINEAARAANNAADFSARIRTGRPGFSIP
jgi:hypothetical protein